MGFQFLGSLNSVQDIKLLFLHGRVAPDEAPCSSIPSAKLSLRFSSSESSSNEYLTASANLPQTHSVEGITLMSGESSGFLSVFESKCTARRVGFSSKNDCIIEICRLSLEQSSGECYLTINLIDMLIMSWLLLNVLSILELLSCSILGCRYCHFWCMNIPIWLQQISIASE